MARLAVERDPNEGDRGDAIRLILRFSDTRRPELARSGSAAARS